MTNEQSGQIAVSGRFGHAVEAHDAEAAIETLAPDVVLHSPITNGVTFNGHAEMRDLFRAVFASIEEIRYFADIGDDRTRALFYRATVKGQSVEEATRIELNDHGLIQEITLFFRPLPASPASPSRWRHEWPTDAAASQPSPLAYLWPRSAS